MARLGVTYKEVAEAAVQLVGQGRNPTIEQIRLILGTGSSSTIANHLRQWKIKQDATNFISIKENLPPEFVALMKGLWERVVNHSEEQVQVIEKNYQVTVSDLNQEVEKYKTNNQRWQKMYDQWMGEKNQLAQEKLTFEQAIEFAQKENVALKLKEDSYLQQLQDKQERIDELRRLHKQTQDNLEHYRESAREQRLSDQQQNEQQQQLLQAEIKSLNDQLMLQREKFSELQQHSNNLQQAYSAAEKNSAQIHLQLEKVQVKLEASEKEKNEYLHLSQHWQVQYQEGQKNLREKSDQCIDTQAELKSLSQQLIEAKQQILDVSSQNKLLQHDKWILAQEKSHLEGQLKQMQHMLPA